MYVTEVSFRVDYRTLEGVLSLQDELLHRSVSCERVQSSCRYQLSSGTWFESSNPWGITCVNRPSASSYDLQIFFRSLVPSIVRRIVSYSLDASEGCRSIWLTGLGRFVQVPSLLPLAPVMIVPYCYIQSEHALPVE